MTTISLLDTEHRSFSHDAREFITQETFDLAIQRWIEKVGRDDTDVTSIYDGSEDVIHALAWRDGDGVVLVHLVPYVEDAGGYGVSDLPFFLDIEHDEPEVIEPVEQMFLTKITSSKELFPVDLRQALATIDPAADFDIRKAY